MSRSFHSLGHLVVATLLASSGACKKTESTTGSAKTTEPPAAATPAPPAQPTPSAAAGTKMSGSDWLRIRGADKLKKGDVVTVSYHTAKEEDAPCYETNKPGKWTCQFAVYGKNAEGADDSDNVRADDLDQAQAAAYMAKVKPDVDVTFTCKVEISSGYATLTECR